MTDNNKLKAPNKKEVIMLRIMILIGLLSIINFFYWFSNKSLIDNVFLYVLLLLLIGFDCFRVLYIWYHYWNMSIPKKPTLTKPFSVDVLTTYFPGEPIEMVTETLRAIKKMRHPHTTYLCDEANDDYLKTFCLEHDIIHVTRSVRIDAKAGNINNALQQATGDLCLILDPDHVPSEDFLEEVIPYFQDDGIGFVQTVQAYYNIEESNVAAGAAEQTFHFYGPLMMGMNSYGTVNAIGANCVFRRAALNSIGGHAPGLSEDLHTAMLLHAKGWKSIYVPESFTKGLVPATLTSYYQQQLKWSKGTFELLTDVYPKLFKQFTWRQKLHYGVLPLHYLSGLMFMISFIIPIIALFFSVTPWKGNILNFGLLVCPILASILLIRFYVQQWVINKNERGVHLIGGLLLQCAWWVFLIGVLYTFIRKKVLYIPTPKSDKAITRLGIILPNISIAIISVIAVIYGLYADFTPFSILMAAFALWNSSILLYTLSFAYEKRSFINFEDFLDMQKQVISNTKREKVFKILNNWALILLSVVLVCCVVLQYDKEQIKIHGVDYEKPKLEHVKYVGAFAPDKDNGVSVDKKISEVEQILDKKMDIISFYIAWDKTIDSGFFNKTLDSVYNKGAIPMITWEPWLNTFLDSVPENKHVNTLIIAGYLDTYINAFALELKKLNKPVFLRYSHEFDNPFYPWYDNTEVASTTFKEAWRHVHDIFRENGVGKVIWVWNPWKAKNVKAFYPGPEYVDWFGVNILNYATLKDPENWYSFKQLYDSFHNAFKTLPETPVMISEFGVLKDGDNQRKWFSSAFNTLNYEFDEIRAIVYFNSNLDNNLPEGTESSSYFDWTISKGDVPVNEFKNKVQYKKNNHDQVLEPKQKDTNINLIPNIKGVNLKKGRIWNQDYHVLSRQNLITDFENMKKLGLNTIRFTENATYDYNVLNLSAAYNLNVSYGFWIPENINFRRDTIRLKQLENKILDKIAKNNHRTNIITWSIQNDVLSNQKTIFNKPELFYQNKAYLLWLNNLVIKIKNIDSKRPVILDVEVNSKSYHHFKLIQEYLPNIDVLGLVVSNTEYLDGVLDYVADANINYELSAIDTADAVDLIGLEHNTSFYLTEWQDQYGTNTVTFNGVIDRKGRSKSDYFKLLNTLNIDEKNTECLKINILKPSRLLYTARMFTYHAMIYNQEKDWMFGKDVDGIQFEWSLIKYDAFGNPITILDVGNESKIELDIPNNNKLYKLLLTVIDGDCASTILTTLNTPYNTRG
ncbi:glycosyltransferase family 2 protein [uncultured Formosa sp.]|uniref:glycosyltransferase family 2 protein n=1 Tax=uncultured Formosa sp. TaxID=255435 RepID=UPI00261836E3|nr:glycosyltransferase family 2 protein [uncultured Formosa sp.]